MLQFCQAWLVMLCFPVVFTQGQAGLCVSGCCCWSRCCLRGSYRGHSLQSGGGLVFLEPGAHLESGMLSSLMNTRKVVTCLFCLMNLQRGSRAGTIGRSYPFRRWMHSSQTFMFPRWWILMTFLPKLPHCWSRLKYLIISSFLLFIFVFISFTFFLKPAKVFIYPVKHLNICLNWIDVI